MQLMPGTAAERRGGWAAFSSQALFDDQAYNIRWAAPISRGCWGPSGVLSGGDRGL
jgi:soluble lytic murein transglycosylase-like protein